MIIAKVLLIVIGIAGTIYGYLIYFKKRYNLINGFETDFKAGRKKEAYAKKVGIFDLVLGISLIIIGIYLIFIK
ncbi:MAG: DUF3784 domain-containing protein [Eubacteriales bacterium]|nr:DUF3784 domain-containing protein [Eubacteriales bacterium]MDY3332263.1 DUF3784 domain-containing protein [Gallibacter sp.]